MTKLKIKNQFGETEVKIKNEIITTIDLIEAFHGSMVALGYSNQGLLQEMVNYGEEKLKDTEELEREAKMVLVANLDKDKYFRG